MKRRKPAQGLIILISLCLLPTLASARVIQILHTNDLHASLHTSGAPAAGQIELGGWAQIAAKMEDLTTEAEKKGIDTTIKLDAGDFYEGTMAYFPDMGSSVLKAFQSMGYDATALGNHEWLMGQVALFMSFKSNPFPFPILSANVSIGHYLDDLRKQIFSRTQIHKNGLKIGVFGLSTTDPYYEWILRKIDTHYSDMQLLDYQDRVNQDHTIKGIATLQAEALHKNSDLVIALTHIGIDADRNLAKHSSHIDLIIGGHSHTYMDSMALEVNQKGRTIPIVQTGVNGSYIGKILVEVPPGSPAVVQSYELIPVPHSYRQNKKVRNQITEAEKKLNALYGEPYLNEVLGTSESRLLPNANYLSSYGKFVVDAMRWKTKADVAIDLSVFQGTTAQPKGPITRRMLMELYPRKFEANKNRGLSIYTTSILGLALQLAIKYSVDSGNFVAFSGVTFEVRDRKNTSGSYDVENIRINGHPLDYLKNYTLAVPESLVRGAREVHTSISFLFSGGKPTMHTIWEASFAYLKKIKIIRAVTPSSTEESE